MHGLELKNVELNENFKNEKGNFERRLEAVIKQSEVELQKLS